MLAMNFFRRQSIPTIIELTSRLNSIFYAMRNFPNNIVALRSWPSHLEELGSGGFRLARLVLEKLRIALYVIL